MGFVSYTLVLCAPDVSAADRNLQPSVLLVDSCQSIAEEFE